MRSLFLSARLVGPQVSPSLARSQLKYTTGRTWKSALLDYSRVVLIPSWTVHESRIIVLRRGHAVVSQPATGGSQINARFSGVSKVTSVKRTCGRTAKTSWAGVYVYVYFLMRGMFSSCWEIIFSLIWKPDVDEKTYHLASSIQMRLPLLSNRMTFSNSAQSVVLVQWHRSLSSMQSLGIKVQLRLASSPAVRGKVW